MYYLVEIATGASTVAGYAIYPYSGPNARNEALSRFHTKLGGAMKNSDFDTDLLIVFSETGEQIAREYYVKPFDI